MKKLNKIIGSLVLLLALVLVPKLVLADKIDNIISSKEVTIKSVPINSEMAYYQVNELFGENYEGYGLDNCNEDYTVCDITHYGSEVVAEKVKINYDYDPAVKTVVDNIMKKIPEEGKTFFLNDIETIKYLLDLIEYEGEEELNPIRYSSEYKKFIEYNNFIFEPRMGYDEDFATYKAGTAAFKYNDTIYGFADGIGVRANLVLYVNDDETDIEGALKKRLSKYFDIKSVTKDDSATIEEMLEEMFEASKNDYNNCITESSELENTPFDERDAEWSRRYSDTMSMCWFTREYSTAEEYVESLKETYFEGDNAPLDFIDDIEDYAYVVEFADELSLSFAVIKDSSKVYNGDLTVVNTDASSGVTISTDGVIPLDTLIEVARLTSGEDYEKIIKILKVKDAEMFDLKLFSKSAEDYITKLDNGTFEVKLPISEAFKGKNLIVYYVDENDKVIEYKVEVKDNYAVFNTDHFSIYTLAATETAKETNPNTFDSIMTYISLLILSIVGIFFVSRNVKSNI